MIMEPAERRQTTREAGGRQTGETKRPRALAPEPTVGHVSRRAFLGGLLAAGGAGLLAACAPGQPFVGPYNTATPAQVLASPRAAAGTPEAGEGTPPAEGELGLQQFLALSAVLTGVDNLSPDEGRVYLQALQDSDEFEVSLGELLEQTSDILEISDVSEATIEDLEAQGIFESEGTATLADTIIEYWYTGVYTTAEGEQAVATYVDALAWKALAFTKPNSICASPGFWEDPPEVTL